eukprot:UN4628
MVIVSQWSQNMAHMDFKDSCNRWLAHHVYAKLHLCDCICSDGPLLCSGLHVRSTYLVSKASCPQLLRIQVACDDMGLAITCLSREHLRTY